MKTDFTATADPLPGLSRSLVIGAFMLILSAQLAVTVAPIGPWVATHWLFTYENGFAARSLAGSVIAWIAPALDGRYWVYTAAGFAVLTLLALGGLVLIRNIMQGPAARALWLPLLAAITSPLTVRLMGGDLGRFDHIVLLIGLVQVWAMLSLPPVQALAIALPLVVPAMLIHEVYLFLVAPLVIVTAWLRPAVAGRPWGITPAVMLAATVALTALTTKWATPEPSTSLEAHTAQLSAKADFEAVSGSVVVHHLDLATRLEQTARRMLTPKGAIAFLYLTAVSLPLWLLCWISLRQHVAVLRETGRDRLILLVVLLASATPLALLVIAVDWARWFGGVAVLLSLFTLWVVPSVLRQAGFQTPQETPRLPRQPLLLLGMFGAWLLGFKQINTDVIYGFPQDWWLWVYLPIG